MNVSSNATLKTGPAVEPITAAEVKEQVHYTDTDQDSSITNQIIPAARMHFEHVTGLQLITATWELRMDEFPQTIRLPYPPAQQVISVKYDDTDGVEQTFAASSYRVDVYTWLARIDPAYGETWPIIRKQSNAVTVEYKAGYGDAASDVPTDIRQAILNLAGHWFVHRDPVAIERGLFVVEAPMHMRALFDSFKVPEIY